MKRFLVFGKEGARLWCWMRKNPWQAVERIGVLFSILGGIASIFIAIYANSLTESIFQREGAHYEVIPLMQEEKMVGMGSTFRFNEDGKVRVDDSGHKQILPVLITNVGRTQGTILEIEAIYQTKQQALRICSPAMDDMQSRFVATGLDPDTAHGQFTLQPNESKFLFLVNDNSAALDASLWKDVQYRAFAPDGSNPKMENWRDEVAPQIKSHYLEMEGYKDAERWCME